MIDSITITLTENGKRNTVFYNFDDINLDTVHSTKLKSIAMYVKNYKTHFSNRNGTESFAKLKAIEKFILKYDRLEFELNHVDENQIDFSFETIKR